MPIRRWSEHGIQNPGNHGRDRRRYHKTVVRAVRGQQGDQEYPDTAEGRGEAAEAGPVQYGTGDPEAKAPEGCHCPDEGKAGNAEAGGGAGQ